GLVLHFRPQAVTYHAHELTTAGFVRRQRMAGRMSVLLTRKHPELDRLLTHVVANAQSTDAGDEGALDRILRAVPEPEKPDLTRLDAVHGSGESLGASYRRVVLAPLYRTLLDAAYRVGIREALAAPFDASIVLPVRDETSARRTLGRLAEVTDGSFEVI